MVLHYQRWKCKAEKTMNYTAEIRKIKARLGSKLLILAHHYQRDEIVQLSDIRGDSFKLARESAKTDAEIIIFCGVRFMAETAAALASEHQKVYHPNPDAGCPLADKAEIGDVENAWQYVTKISGATKIIPITYVNSDLAVKAFCGRNDGLTCTSSNAGKAFEWALKRGEKILFFPDEFLGRNTANALKFSPDEIALWNPHEPHGGLDEETIKQAKVFLWKGYCHVHTWFKPEHIESFRQKYPGGKIVVHPECVPEVVDLADAAGSTEFIIDFVKQALVGSFIGVGTELNLVERLGKENPDKRVVPISESLCPNMFRINLGNLYTTLVEIDNIPPVAIDENIKRDALVALNRMLEL